MLNLKSESELLNKSDLINYYKKNCKPKSQFKVGLEYEQLSLDVKTNKNADYENLDKIITHFAQIKGWGILKDSGITIGAIGGNSSVSLEPGGQFEISMEPKENLSDIENSINENLVLLEKIAKAYGVKFVPLGLSPYSTYQNIDIVKKSRYLIMAKYLKKMGAFSPVMMRETAGVQVNFDYESEYDALLKLRASAKISPFATAFFANSPMRNGKMTQYKSFRALAWKYTDKNRCSLFYKNLLDNQFGTFEDYIDEILNVPMIFFERGNKKILVNGEINFKDFMKYGFGGYNATFEDYLLHSSLTFGDVRLKNCIEIRNHDSQKLDVALGICAFYKGILHFKDSILKVDEMLNYSAKELDEMGFLASKYGMEFDPCASEILMKLFEISYKNLSNDEKKYLEPLIKRLECGKLIVDEYKF